MTKTSERAVTFKFITSSMNGGKTTQLLQTVHSWRSRGFSVILLKPSDDTRNTEITSRIGATAEVDITVSKEDDLCEVIRNFIRVRPGLNHVLIAVDEAQFLTPSQVEDLFLLSTSDAPVYCYGLKTNFRGFAFPGSARLLELADVEEIDIMKCRCGKPARFNARFDSTRTTLISEGSEKLIEGSTEEVIYDPLCPLCFVIEGGFTRQDSRDTGLFCKLSLVESDNDD